MLIIKGLTDNLQGTGWFGDTFVRIWERDGLVCGRVDSHPEIIYQSAVSVHLGPPITVTYVIAFKF